MGRKLRQAVVIGLVKLNYCLLQYNRLDIMLKSIKSKKSAKVEHQITRETNKHTSEGCKRNCICIEAKFEQPLFYITNVGER